MKRNDLLVEELKRMKTLVGEREVVMEKDLTGVEGTFANYIQNNLNDLERYVKDPNKLKAKLEKDMQGLKISDQYKRKFFDTLDKQRTPTARLMFLSNAMLKGAGMGAV